MRSGSLAVIGGGVIGLAVARRAALDGWSVRVHRTLEQGASWVAGGMLAPHSEGWPGEERLLQIGLASLRMWHDDFLDGLPADVVTARESLMVAVDRADAADLATTGQWLAAQGHPVTMTTAARDVEPLLAQGIRHGFVAETELAVDNRALVAALAARCESLGVTWAPPVHSLDEARDVDTTVIANGIDAPTLWPGLPIRPVKGEVLRLRWRAGCMPLPQRVIRARVHGRQVYLVPRADGVVVGATQYEHGRDTAPAVAGVRALLDDACEVMPALGEYELAECAAGSAANDAGQPTHRRTARRTHPGCRGPRPVGLPAGAVDGRPHRGRTESGGVHVLVVVNGEDVQIDEDTTVAELLETRGFPRKGIAVAVDWTVVPRSEWHRTLSDGAKLEIVTAVQGG